MYTDGLIEIENDAGDTYGFDRLEKSILNACDSGYRPEVIIEKAFASVAEFDASPEQAADQTMVVIEFT